MNDLHSVSAYGPAYGHPHVILDRLADWISATDAYCAPLEITDAMRHDLVTTTQDLVRTIQAIPYGSPGSDKTYAIIRNIIGLSGAFLWDQYTDSDTDAPCDVEWDVTGLVGEILGDYVRPDEVQPAYVMGTVYPTPEV